MEARHVEIERFSRKAEGYKTAIEAVPEARALECSVIGAILLGHCRKNGLNPVRVKVLDAMAGSGYLARHLHKIGFREIHAAEACAEMLPSPTTRVEDGITLHKVDGTDGLSSLINKLQPSIVVSLAGFHHLIVYDGRNVDRFQSVLWQYQLIHKWVCCLPRNAIVLIVDIAETGAASELNLQPIETWDASVFSKLISLPKVLLEATKNTNNISEYNRVLKQLFPEAKENPSVSWFREVVNKETKIGHDDIALSHELLILLSLHHSIHWTTFYCPWLFSSMENLKFYLVHKFGFNIGYKIDKQREKLLANSASNIVGIKKMDSGNIAMGWNLSALIIEGSHEKTIESALFECNISLACANAVLFVRFILGMLFPHSFIRTFGIYMDALVSILAGISISGLIKLFNKGNHK